MAFIPTTPHHIGTVEYQVEGSFIVPMWALLLRCATSQVTGILG